MYDLTVLEWLAVVFGAICIGLGKGAFPGMSILAIGLYAHVFEPANSVGIIVVILLIANVLAVIIYRKSADWRCIVRLLPSTLIGMILGYFFLMFLPTEHMGRLMGLMLLLMAGVHFHRSYYVVPKIDDNKEVFYESKDVFFSFSVVSIGLLTGFSSMVANVSGPITVIYFMYLKMEKLRFIGTIAGLYLILNGMKIPFHVSLKNVNTASIELSLFLSIIAVGTVLVAPIIVKHVPQKIFNFVIWLFVVIASLKLIF